MTDQPYDTGMTDAQAADKLERTVALLCTIEYYRRSPMVEAMARGATFIRQHLQTGNTDPPATLDRVPGDRAGPKPAREAPVAPGPAAVGDDR